MTETIASRLFIGPARLRELAPQSVKSGADIQWGMSEAGPRRCLVGRLSRRGRRVGLQTEQSPIDLPRGDHGQGPGPNKTQTQGQAGHHDDEK